ncbi:SGNH/GDSL hydrolase family protein [Coraliomargarita parva]|uniref:SGNH/GDSL hydrolase family protein n=1 Tax=Coraliomargarita parva TaxID=3014050 RepID=UPI0022B36163|nr:SGNH/GDSL hydrolase family protein [Coraliomargarita parva]
MFTSTKSARSALMAVACLFTTQFMSAEPLVRSGQKIAFLGDSITEQGFRTSSGYVNLVRMGLEANDLKIEVIPAGKSGHKSNQMLGRLQRDVLEKQPDWMTLSCGVNDVWHQSRNAGVLLPAYKENITKIVDQCEAAGVKILLLTATPIKEVENELNQKLVGYNDFLRELAVERNLPLADTSAAFWQTLETESKPSYKGLFLTVDGVHMNPVGDMLMATEVLKAFGLDEAQLAKAEAAWMNVQTRVNAGTNLRVEDYMKLRQLAEQKEDSPGHLLNLTYKNAVKELLTEPTE